MLTLRRSVATLLVSAASTGLVAVLAACSSADPSFADTLVSGEEPDSGASGVSVVRKTADASTTDASVAPSSTPDATADPTIDPSDAGPFLAGYAAPHAAFPAVLNSGGTVLVSPKFVLLSWDGYDYESEIEELTSRIGASTYWSTVTGEYGIGPGTYVKRVSLGSAASSRYTDAQLRTVLSNGFAQLPALGTPDPSTVYIFLVPKSTAVSFQGGTSCSGFAGYHQETAVNGVHVPYAVIGECAKFNGLTGIDAVTGTLSHELIEAVTDPFPEDHPAYQNPSNANLGWSEGASGGELADMCAGDPEAFFYSKEISLDAGAVGSAVLQRSWSNANIASGIDPCVPDLPNKAYFEAMPVVPDILSVTFSDSPEQYMVDGVDVGSTSETFEVDLFSDRPTRDWTVSGIDVQGYLDNTSYMTFSISGGTGGGSTTTGNNGTKLQVTITPTAAGLSAPGIYEFGILSDQGTGSAELAHYSWGMVSIGGN